MLSLKEISAVCWQTFLFIKTAWQGWPTSTRTGHIHFLLNISECRFGQAGTIPLRNKGSYHKNLHGNKFYFDTEMVLRSSDLLVSEFVTCLRSVILAIHHALKWWQNWKWKSPAPPGFRVCWGGQYKQCLSFFMLKDSDSIERKWALNFKTGMIFEQSVW